MPKKMFVVLVLSLILAAGFSTIVLADNGPHGGFSGATDACAGCHRAHSANSSDGFLLISGSAYALCISCHDGSGAATDVVNGYYHGTAQGEDQMGLFGGGFSSARMLTDYGSDFNAATFTYPDDTTTWAGKNAYDTAQTAPVGAITTSTHNATGVGISTVWGSGIFDDPSPANYTMVLHCTSCHDPHGNAGRSAANEPIPSYRLLRFSPQDTSSGTGYEILTSIGAGTDYDWNTNVAPAIGGVYGITVPDLTTKWYTLNTNRALDPSLEAYRSKSSSTDLEMFVAISAGRGDYGARYYGYRRPATEAANSYPIPVTPFVYISCGDLPTGGRIAPTECANATGSSFDNVPAHDRLGYWCATCHDRYLARGGETRTTDTGDPAYHYRHLSQENIALPVTYSITSGVFTCVDCHNAHGTSGVGTAMSNDASLADDSALLKSDGRVFCVRCHAESVNFFNTVVSPDAVMEFPTP